MSCPKVEFVRKLVSCYLTVATLLLSVSLAAVEISAPIDTENYWVCPMHPEETSDSKGRCSICNMHMVEMKDDKPRQKAIAGKHFTSEPDHFTCPMHSQIKRQEQGLCPICGMDLVPVYRDPDHSDQGVVLISPAIENNLGVKTAAVKWSPFAQRIETVGYVQFNEDSLIHVHTRVEGWIEKLSVNSVGDTVRAGQTLFEIYAPELVSAQQEYLIAKNSGNTQLLKASRQRLRLLDVSDRQIKILDQTGKASERLAIKAERDGYVSNLSVRQGMFVKPSTEIMALGELTNVWVIAEVFERQSAWLRKGQKVTMQTDSYPGRSWQGVVEYIYPVLNAQSRTLEVRVLFQNLDQILKPNMYTNITIHADDSRHRLSIPRSALIRGGRQDRVVKSLGGGRYRSVIVTAGFESGDRVEIIDGLDEGEKVVVSAQFMIDSESNLQVDMSRMEAPSGHNHGGH